MNYKNSILSKMEIKCKNKFYGEILTKHIAEAEF